MNPVQFLIKALLTSVRTILALISAGRIDEAKAKLETMESNLEKLDKEQ